MGGAVARHVASAFSCRLLGWWRLATWERARSAAPATPAPHLTTAAAPAAAADIAAGAVVTLAGEAVLLYPGGVREGFKRRNEKYELFWPAR